MNGQMSFRDHRHDVGGHPYRYGYSVSISADPADGWQTLKHDLQSGETMVFDHGP